MSYYNYYSYKKKAKPKDPAAQIQKLRKKNPDIQPVIIEGRKLARSWWALSWNKNLEGYADYSNRISRGRSYVISGAVLDLVISPGVVSALVQGSRAAPYEITVQIDPLSKNNWDAITRKCSRRLANIEELVSGQFPLELMELFTQRGVGLFPTPKEIHFNCSCPDWASMCKHVAAVLYGIGARFDQDPTLFFILRDIDVSVLIKKSVDEKMTNLLKNADNVTDRTITGINTYDLFGV